MKRLGAAFAAAAAGLTLGACEVSIDAEDEAPAAPTVAEAETWMTEAEAAYLDAAIYKERVDWVNRNFITVDTDWLGAKAASEYTALRVRLANEAKRFAGLELPPELARKITLLKTGLTLPAPETAGAAEELNNLATALQSAYGKGKGLYKGTVTPGVDLEALMGTERDPDALLEMWTSWRQVAPPMKPQFERLVEIANAGAGELGYADLGQMWRSNYDMDPDEFAALTDKLWGQVKPLYDELHCHVRAKLGDYYGARLVPQDGPIPAHLLGNMWAQQWGNIYDLVAPEEADPGYDVTELLVAAGYDARKMAKTGEEFFSSLGFAPLPETFWERSLFTKPADREVVCHASAWDIDYVDDIRIKMCTKVNADDFQTMHHELGHNYYQRAYNTQSPLHREGANDGFHEAIGDMIALSITPDYLVKIGLLSEDQVPPASADLGLLMSQALDKIAFLPFGLLVDKWRWQVFSGETTPETYNQDWWNLRTHYQGITPPVARMEGDFDPGAKFHIPANVPYARYFLAHILQFQFHQAACEMAGWEGPLHRCSIYGNAEVGARFNAMMELGMSEPWPDALEAFTGTREMDGSAIIAYFQPLIDYLEEQNQGRQCGW